MKPGAAVKDNAAVEVFIKGFKNRFAQESVSLFKAGFPLVFKFITVVVDKAVERGIFRSMVMITALFLLWATLARRLSRSIK